ncbi:hypothetical protein BGZ96_006449 [Linnemannia gamsii]|uniref:Glutaredoxin domain-containing protein n=1 Tax=Linnemannia gamsii TaxID=64522 RepID=A0ABQ7K3R5_9FUNG|nr:hypothetical protein BGZ96_006449 [Linnemannia gamsii]
MESLSTSPKPKNVITTIVRSRRFRVLAVVLVAFYCVFYFATVYRAGGSSDSELLTAGKSLTQQGHPGRTEVDGEGEPMMVDADEDRKDVKETPMVLLERRVHGLIDQNRIMVFSKTYCPYSAVAKKLLNTYTTDYEVLEVDREPRGDGIKNILRKITDGHATFPSIFFAGESIGGRDKLQEIEDKGELRKRLEKLGVKML